MKIKSVLAATAVAMGAMTAQASAASITFTETALSQNAITAGGVTMTPSSPDGDISRITSGIYTGLYIGVNDANGTYYLVFSEAISSIEIEFDALSDSGGSPPETIFGFGTENGGVSVGYTNQFGTSWDGTTITSTAPDGQGIITYAGSPFTTFLFTHDQAPGQNGFVIERIVINTVDGAVPLPAAAFLFAPAAAAALGLRRKKKARV